MERLKTFLIYILILVAFFWVSKGLEHGLIWQMYYSMDGTVEKYLNYNGEIIDLDIKVKEAEATRVNGYINISITNNSNTKIEEAYIKVMLYSKSGVYATQKYMEINDLEPGQTKEYSLKFKGSYINKYAITAEKEFPDKDYMFDFFGYEINTRDIFGLDLSEFINAKSIGEFVGNVFHSITVTVKSVPWWAYLWAWMIIVGVW
ncbi:MAG: hypothetical protein HFJ45_05355 [Clostridia bacterium]|nr:hypothetical protein [Clostridia bacterium]